MYECKEKLFILQLLATNTDNDETVSVLLRVKTECKKLKQAVQKMQLNGNIDSALLNVRFSFNEITADRMPHESCNTFVLILSISLPMT